MLFEKQENLLPTPRKTPLHSDIPATAVLRKNTAQRYERRKAKHIYSSFRQRFMQTYKYLTITVRDGKIRMLQTKSSHICILTQLGEKQLEPPRKGAQSEFVRCQLKMAKHANDTSRRQQAGH